MNNETKGFTAPDPISDAPTPRSVGEASDEPSLEGESCIRCPMGRYEKGRFTRTMEKGDTVVVVKDVPGYLCDTCSEKTMSSEVVDRLDAILQRAVEGNVDSLVCRFQDIPLVKVPTDTAERRAA